MCMCELALSSCIAGKHASQLVRAPSKMDELRGEKDLRFDQDLPTRHKKHAALLYRGGIRRSCGHVCLLWHIMYNTKDSLCMIVFRVTQEL